MYKKLSFTLFAGVLLSLGTAFATNYGLYIAGTQVTSSNAGNIMSGVWFDETTHTLFLNRATINGSTSNTYGIKAEASLNNLNIVVIGTGSSNVVGASGDAAIKLNCNTTISGYQTLNAYPNSSASGGDGIYVAAGNLTITDGVTVKASAKGYNYGAICGDFDNNVLTVNNANLICYAPTGSNGVIYAFGSVVFNGVSLNPSGATYNTSAQELRVGSNTLCDTFKATVNGGYGLWVAGKYVMSSGSITGTGISGNVSYNPSSATLTLDNATINTPNMHGIYSKNALKVTVTGNNSIKTTMKTGTGLYYSTGDNTLTGSGSVYIEGPDAIDGGTGNLTISECSVKAISPLGGNWGPICGGRNLTINHANVMAYAPNRSPIYWWDNVTFTNCVITKPAGATYNNNSSAQYIEYNGAEYEDTIEISNGSPQSITLAENQNISIFPNPATSNVKITSTASIQQVEVISTNGAVVLSQYVNGNNASINVQNLKNGIYAVRFRTDKGTSVQRMAVAR